MQLRIRASVAIAALALTGSAGVINAATGEAHTGSLSVTQKCLNNGNRLVTYSGNTISVPATGKGHKATLTVGEIKPSGTSVAPTSQTVVGNASYSFTQTVPGTAKSAQATAFLVWGDGAKSDPIGKITFTANCSPAVPEKPADIVTHDSSETKDCDTAVIVTHHTTTTIGHQLVYNGWVALPPVTVNEPDTTRPATLEECPAPEKPADTVTYTEWTGSPDCATNVYTEGRSKTVIGHHLEGRVWVEDAPVTTTETNTRTATTTECPVITVNHRQRESLPDCVTNVVTVYYEDQTVTNGVEGPWVQVDNGTRPVTVQECPPVVVPEKPADKVTVDSGESEPDCASGVVWIWTSTTTISPVLVDGVWVDGEPVVVETSSIRDVTEAECPVVVPPTTEPPVVVPPTTKPPVVVPPTKTITPQVKAPQVKAPANSAVPKVTTTPVAAPELPHTGTDGSTYVGLGIVAVLLLLFGAAAVRGARREPGQE